MAGVKRSLGAMLGHEEIMLRSNGFGKIRDHGHGISSRNSEAQTEQTPTLTLAETLHSQSRNSSRSQSQSQPPSTRPEQQDAVTRTPSPTFPPLTGEVPEFAPDASMLLAGIRGAGKSTLAIMASSAMDRKVIDLETAFQKTSGLSSAAYKAEHGSAACYKHQAKVLQNALDRHRTGCILVCSWMESRIQNLLREFAATHPVIHIVRDADAIQNHLKFRDKAKIRNLLNVSNAIFRTCTNFEFFNVSEKPTRSSLTRIFLTQRTPAPYLTLKHVERHFLKFLSLIYPAGTIPFMDSAFPLARIPPEERRFTYATSIPLSDVLNDSVDIEEHVAGADVVQIVVHDLADHAEAGTLTAETSSQLLADITKGIGVVRRSTILPIILHLFLPHTASEDVVRVYLDLIHHTLRLAPEMMTVDLRLEDSHISRILTVRKRTKIIGNAFIITDPPSWESPMWMNWYKKANTLGCHLARLIRPAANVEDNFRINHLRSSVDALQGPKIPLIAYNSGPLGRNSAAFNRILTVVRPDSLERVNPKPPITPCITAVGATKALFSSFIYNEMKLYVFGTNVSYSLSPAMHTCALKACGVPHTYEPVSCASLRGIRHLIEDSNFGGASIGLPFKVEIITLTHSLSNHARAIGAVNTLIPIRSLNEDGSIPTGAAFFDSVNQSGPIKALYGENTDWIGIRACIRRGLSPANAVVASTCGLVIGAGGMARATIYAMLQVGIKNIVVYNRTPQNAQKMVSHFTELLQRKDFKLLSAGSEGAQFHVIESLEDAWPADVRLPTVVVSCIPTHRIGNVPAPDLTLPDEWLGSRTGGVAIDLGYKTLDTPFLAQFRKESSRGWVSMDGLDMLPEQGFAQFELFTGRRAPRRIMRREVFQAYPAGEGKSNFEELGPRLQSLDEQEA
ncbi:Quinate repressor protein [Fusarium sp. Ph1]|nr:Quinate repressor protein [Fusarium sp. Ph1]